MVCLILNWITSVPLSITTSSSTGCSTPWSHGQRQTKSVKKYDETLLQRVWTEIKLNYTFPTVPCNLVVQSGSYACTIALYPVFLMSWLCSAKKPPKTQPHFIAEGNNKMANNQIQHKFSSIFATLQPDYTVYRVMVPETSITAHCIGVK